MIRKNFRKYLILLLIIGFLAIILSFLPMLFFYNSFSNSELSKDISDWSAFGSYLSGTSGIILSFFAVIFSLISIYISARIAQSIQDKEFKFRQVQSKVDRQIIHAQNTPYPYLDLTRLIENTEVAIQNMGLGPLIITRIWVVYNGVDEYRNLKELLQDKIGVKLKILGARVNYDTAPQPVLAPNKSKSILKIVPVGEISAPYIQLRDECRNILKDCEVFINYEDIFKREFSYRKHISFLANPLPLEEEIVL